MLIKKCLRWIFEQKREKLPSNAVMAGPTGIPNTFIQIIPTTKDIFLHFKDSIMELGFALCGFLKKVWNRYRKLTNPAWPFCARAAQVIYDDNIELYEPNDRSNARRPNNQDKRKATFILILFINIAFVIFLYRLLSHVVDGLDWVITLFQK